MKPLHAGLLIVGAALAGGLAVKMTEPQPFPSLPAASPIEVNHAPPPPAAAAAVPVNAAPAKPSPMPDSIAPAPAPVYVEPARPPAQRAAIQKTPVRPPVQPPVQNAKPNLTAKADLPPFLPPVPYEAPAHTAPPQPETPPPPQAVAVARRVTLPTGMALPVRLNESLSSDRGAPGDTFSASLAEPLVVDGLVIAERGARVGGRMVDLQKAGRFSGRSLVELELTSLVTADGQKVSISTEPWTKNGDTSHREDAAQIGGGAALGAIVGAIAGGGTGAAIGAGVGGGVAAGTVAATRGKPVSIPSETIIRFRLASRVTIQERQL